MPDYIESEVRRVRENRKPAPDKTTSQATRKYVNAASDSVQIAYVAENQAS
jgi:hypothetical protein